MSMNNIERSKLGPCEVCGVNHRDAKYGFGARCEPCVLASIALKRAKDKARNEANAAHHAEMIAQGHEWVRTCPFCSSEDCPNNELGICLEDGEHIECDPHQDGYWKSAS